MVTLTAPHDLGMQLDSLLDLISVSFSTVIGGRLWCGTPERYVPERPSKRGGTLPAKYYPARPGVRDQLGIAGTVRSLEVTYGEHGWHPHLHVLVFVRGQLDAARRAKFEVHFRNQWRKAIVARHPRPPDPVHGVKVERCYSGEGAADYVCKTQEGHSVGIEMTRADIKRARGQHRTPFEILASAATYTSEADVRLWHEFEAATKARKCITWSRGLRDAIAAVMPDPVHADDWLVTDLTDEEIVALEPTFTDEHGNPHVEPVSSADSETVATVSRAAARRARSVPGFRVAVLEAFEDGKLDGLADVLGSLGFEVVWDRDPLVPVIVRARPAMTTEGRGAGATRNQRDLPRPPCLKFISPTFLSPVSRPVTHCYGGLRRAVRVPVRCCETCGRTFTQGRGRPARFCPEHRDGGGRYGAPHRKLVATTKDSAYGRPCSRCGRPMLPGEELQLDHADGGGPADYRGWSHKFCNLSAGAKRGNAMRGQVNGHRAPGGPSAARAEVVVVPPKHEPGSVRHRPDCSCGGRVVYVPGEWYTSRCW